MPASPFCPFCHCHGFSFRLILNALRARLAVSPNSEASSKRQGDGQRFQKKAMKTTNQKIEASAPANVRPSSVSKHQTNRCLSTETVLNYLRTRLPRQYEVAEVVGKWVWLDVSPARKPGLASLLWTSRILVFHATQFALPDETNVVPATELSSNFPAACNMGCAAHFVTKRG